MGQIRRQNFIKISAKKRFWIGLLNVWKKMPCQIRTQGLCRLMRTSYLKTKCAKDANSFEFFTNCTYILAKFYNPCICFSKERLFKLEKQ